MNATEKSIIVPVTIGSMFEWFDVFLFIYWAPIMAKNFFDFSTPIEELIYTLLILGTGFIALPMGGVIFGRIGDKWGRRTSFLISIVAITVPSIAVAFTPNFTDWAYGSLIYIGIMRFLKGIPAGGELPGAWCLLYEGASPERRRYVSSYLFVGPQIGQTLSMVLVFSLQKFLTNAQLLSWGWRLSFLIGGVIGIIGYFVRMRLHESIPFEHLKAERKIEQNPLRESFRDHKKNLVLAFFISIFEVVGYFMIYFFLFENSKTILHINPSHTLLIYALYMIALTVMMPLIGRLGNRLRNRFLFKLSAWGVIAFSFPFYLAVESGSIYWIFFFLNLLILFFGVQFSLLPALIGGLFPTAVRFTCIGFSFNIADGVIGGAIPGIGAWLLQITGKPGAFIVLFPLTAVIFLFCLYFIKPESKSIHSLNGV